MGCIYPELSLSGKTYGKLQCRLSRWERLALTAFSQAAFCQKPIELSARKHIGLSDRKAFLMRLTYPICQTVPDVQK